MKTNRVVNQKELKTKNAIEMFFSWIELYKKVFPNLKLKNIIFGGRNISSNSEIR
jgi:hypothetical protein